MQSSSPDPYSSDVQSEPSSTSVHPDEESSSPDCSMPSSRRADRRKQRRNATVLIEWIEDHPYNPYPTKQEKQQLAFQSGMTTRQLNDWFANARRNIKRQGFELWRKKRNGIPNGSKTAKMARVMPPNVLVGSSITGQLPQRTATYPSLPIPAMYGSTAVALQAALSSPIGITAPSTSSQQSLRYTRISNPVAGPSGWFSAGPSSYRPPAPVIKSQQHCTCSNCASRIFGDHDTICHQLPHAATIPLTSIPWTSQVPSGAHFGYNEVTAELKDEAWSPQGSPDSCEDMLSLVLEPKEELVSSSDCLSP